MAAFKDLVEPSAIVIILTLGALLNKRSGIRSRSPTSSPLLRRRSISPTSTTADPAWIKQRLPDNTKFEDNLTSRILSAFPFLVEILYWNLTYWVYQLARAATAVSIVGNEQIWNQSRSHALAILSFEKKIGLAVEKPIQQWTLESAPRLMSVYAKIYYSHIIVSVAFYVYAYTYFRRESFQRIRRTLAACNLVAFIILSAYRVMPPRLLPERYGFVDVLHPSDGSSGSAWTHNRFQLTIAAMPSLHFGMASFVAYCLMRFSPHKYLQAFAAVWPTAMLCTILATANHFLLDAMVGALVPVVAWRINKVFLVFRPVEEWLFWLAKTAKPRTADQDPPAYRAMQKRQDEEERLH